MTRSKADQAKVLLAKLEAAKHKAASAPESESEQARNKRLMETGSCWSDGMGIDDY